MYLGTCSFPFVFVLVLSVYMLKVTAASFDKQGRLLQAEYAFAAAKKGGTILATKSKDKILLVSLSPKTFEYTDNIDHSLGDISSSGPFKALNKNTYICGTGVSADLRYLSDSMLEKSLDHSITFNSPMPLERLANEIAETLYENTLREGRRPYGVSILLFGRSTSSARKDLDSSVLHGEEGEDCSPLKIIEIDLLGNVHDCLLTCIGETPFIFCSLG
jgi:20S proteasome alpha/beta subunit